MYLGIEIGGTKLQLGVGPGDAPQTVALERYDVDQARGADGILRQIERAAGALVERHAPQSIGIGFGGPVAADGRHVVKSHHVAGWNDLALADWCQARLGLEATIANDADTAALAEARFGAGRGANPVFYVTVGTGIGGGLVIDDHIYRGSGAGAAELGHLRPGLQADDPEAIVEAFSAGWGIAAAAAQRVGDPVAHPFGVLTEGRRRLDPEAVRQRLIEVEEAAEPHAADLLERCQGNLDRLTAKMVAEAAREGNEIAEEILARACQALGWAIAQMITLVAPEVVVIGGGVALMGEQLLGPLRQEVAKYVFGPFADRYRIVPAALGELSVVHGALALAADAQQASSADAAR